MLKHYIKIAWRNMIKSKGYSFINILGLAIGMASCIMILLWVQDELTFNLFHEKAGQIYRVNKKYQIGDETSYNPSTPYPLAQAAKENYARIIDATKYYRTSVLITYKNKIFQERQVCVTDSAFFHIFTFSFIKGTDKTALSKPGFIVITERLANKYFSDQDPIGKVVTMDNNKELTVAGVIRNTPSNSDLQFDLFLPMASMIRPDVYDDWGSHRFRTFILLQNGTNVGEVEKQLSKMIQEKLPEEKISLAIQSLKDIHLYSLDGKMEGMKYVYFFTAIAIFILTIACINFINLATARSEKRAKEVGMRKVSGAKRSQIILQFFCESIICAMCALAIALVLIQFCKPLFNQVTNKEMITDYSKAPFILGLVLFVLFTGFISGSYPAFFISSFQPIKVFKGTFGQTHKKKSFRKILVIIQFTLSISLLIATSVIYHQLRYMQKRNLGYNKENILYLGLNNDVRKNYDLMKQQLLQNPDIVGISRTSELPTEIWAIMRGIKWEGKQSDEGAAFAFAGVDYDYIGLLNLQLLKGRNFSIKFPSDSANFIFNEKAIKLMGMVDPIGKQFALNENTKGSIIGVIKDFHSLPLTFPIEPLLLMIQPDFYSQILIKVRSDDLTRAVRSIETVWNKIAPAYPFEYHFLDERFDRLYGEEIRAGMVFKYFVVLAIFISCLGLYGLVSFTVEQKTKEIGIRKVMGASVTSLLVALIKEYAKWVLFANLIAWPIAYYFMNNWLQNFVYHDNISWFSFVGAGVMALIITITTVSYQIIRAALANPVKSLRYE